jgi:drug/metabolite transporter (DMT)-like permease
MMEAKSVKERRKDFDKKNVITVMLMMAVATTGTANSFASKIRADAYGEHDFVVVVYGSIVSTLFYTTALLVSIQRGSITISQIRKLFRTKGYGWLILAAISDSMSEVTGYAAQPHVSSLVYSLMCQATTPFTVVVSILFLRTRYWFVEIVGVAIMIGGAAICLLLKKHKDDDGNNTFWAIFTAMTTVFSAISFVLKEKTFKDYKKSSNNENTETMTKDLEDPLLLTNDDEEEEEEKKILNEKLSVFLVGFIVAITSLLVCVPVALLNQLILTSNPVWPEFKDAFKCIANCDHGLTTYLVYAAINVIYNLCILTLTSHVSALLAFLSLKMTVPLVAILSPVSFPLIGSQPVTFGQWASLFVMAFGLILFRYYNDRRRRSLI